MPTNPLLAILYTGNLKKGETFKGWKVWKSQSKNKKMKKYPSLIQQRYLLLKEENVEIVVECLALSLSIFYMVNNEPMKQ